MTTLLVNVQLFIPYSLTVLERTRNGLGTEAETDSNASPKHPKPYVHVRNGNDMRTGMTAKYTLNTS